MKALPPRHLDEWQRDQDFLRERGQDPLDDFLEQNDPWHQALEARADRRAARHATEVAA